MDFYNRVNKKEKTETKKIVYLILLLLMITLLIYFFSGLLQTPKIDTVGTVDGWLGYCGGIVGGAMTMIGVYATLNFERKSRENDLIIEQCPLITIDNPLSQPKLELEKLEEDDGSKEYWSLGYNIVFKLLLANSNPAIAIKPIFHLSMSHSDDTNFGLSINKTKDTFNLTTNGQKHRFTSHVDYNPGIMFVESQDETNSLFVNKIYFEYYNSFGNKYILEVTHTLRIHGQKKSCTHQYDFKRDYEYCLCLIDGRKLYYSDYVDTKLYYNEDDIKDLEKQIKMIKN